MCQMACEQCKTCSQPTAWARGVTRRAMYLSVRGVWGGTDGPRWAADVSPSPRLLARPRNPAPSAVIPRGRQKRGSSPRHSPRRGVHEVELDICGVKHGNELASAEPGWSLTSRPALPTPPPSLPPAPANMSPSAYTAASAQRWKQRMSAHTNVTAALPVSSWTRSGWLRVSSSTLSASNSFLRPDGENKACKLA